MSNKHSEQKLQELYQARKQNISAPGELKEAILNSAKREKSSVWRWLNWQSAVAFCCLVVVVGHLSKNPQGISKPAFTVSHSVNNDNEDVYFIDVNFQQRTRMQATPTLTPDIDSNHRSYLDSLAKLENSHRLRGRVKQMEHGVAIEICQLGVVHISEQIVQQMLAQGMIHGLDRGQEVLLLANQQGMLIGIEAAPSGPKCDV